MKKLIPFMILLTMVAGSYAVTGNTTAASNGNAAVVPEKKVEVYYFHFTRRCMTCNNVEKVSKEAVEQFFADKVKKGEITFKSINLDEKEGEAIGAKLKVEGQTLLIVSGDKRVDLTDKGFLYANSSPDKLKAEIKKVIEEMM